MYYGFKVGLFLIVSVVFWGAMLYFMTDVYPEVQTKLALEQLKNSDEAARNLRTTSTGISWAVVVSYFVFSFSCWWGDFIYFLGSLTSNVKGQERKEL